MAEKIIHVETFPEVSELVGTFDSNLSLLEREFGVEILNRGGELRIKGEESGIQGASDAIKGWMVLLEKGETLNEQNLHYALSMAEQGSVNELSKLMQNCICITAKGKPIKAKTVGQENYVNAIRDNTVIFGIGPAGTGKTYLAVAMAVKAFKAKEVDRIILTRPAVEAGESLGFLPGDLQQKVDPYLRPLYDALFDMLGPDNFQRQVERGTIEVAPLAYMRGRTLDNSFIILDEAQNTTSEQMKMFLTRLGMNSKAVVTGDITQIDLPGGKKSGLKEVTYILKGIEGIETVNFTAKDVVRHHIVQEIVKAYDNYGRKMQKNSGKKTDRRKDNK